MQRLLPCAGQARLGPPTFNRLLPDTGAIWRDCAAAATGERCSGSDWRSRLPNAASWAAQAHGDLQPGAACGRAELQLATRRATIERAWPSPKTNVGFKSPSLILEPQYQGSPALHSHEAPPPEEVAARLFGETPIANADAKESKDAYRRIAKRTT